MKIVLGAVGRLKDGPERLLFERYVERFDASGKSIGLGPLRLAEIVEGRAAEQATRRIDESERLVKAVGPAQPMIVLDEHGRSLGSEQFTKLLARYRDDGAQTAAFLIGGPDGHGAAALSAATFKLSLGPMTLPHGLARIVLVEQLYRAVTILTGHPYHRA